MEPKEGDIGTSDNETEILVYVNFEDPINDYTKSDLMKLKILGLDTDEPILQLGNKVFGGSWRETVGTAVLFEEVNPQNKRCYFSENVPKPLKYYAETRKALHMRRIFISEKETVANAETQRLEKRNTDGKFLTDSKND